MTDIASQTALGIAVIFGAWIGLALLLELIFDWKWSFGIVGFLLFAGFIGGLVT